MVDFVTLYRHVSTSENRRTASGNSYIANTYLQYFYRNAETCPAVSR